MSPLKTGAMATNVYAINDKFVNLFVLGEGDTFIMIDAGNSTNAIEVGLKKIGVDKSKIRAIFLTHSDNDHSAGLRMFPTIPCYISNEEEDIISGKGNRILFFKNKLAVKPNHLNDNQIATIGSLKIQTILSPGHTPGSVCYIVNDSILFTGDNIGLHNGDITTFSKLFNMNTELQARSILKIVQLKGITHIFTSHNGRSDNIQKAFSSYVLK